MEADAILHRGCLRANEASTVSRNGSWDIAVTQAGDRLCIVLMPYWTFPCNNWLTFFGSALPFDFFITKPTSTPWSFFSPAR